MRHCGQPLLAQIWLRHTPAMTMTGFAAPRAAWQQTLELVQRIQRPARAELVGLMAARRLRTGLVAASPGSGGGEQVHL